MYFRLSRRHIGLSTYGLPDARRHMKVFPFTFECIFVHIRLHCHAKYGIPDARRHMNAIPFTFECISVHIRLHCHSKYGIPAARRFGNAQPGAASGSSSREIARKCGFGALDLALSAGKFYWVSRLGVPIGVALLCTTYRVGLCHRKVAYVDLVYIYIY